MQVDQAHDEQALKRTSVLAGQSRHELVEWQGCRVSWRGFGSGRPLVLLHGGHGSWLHWVPNIEALAAHHAVWVPDLPGYGESDAPALDGSLPSLLAPTLGTLDSVVGAATPVDLVGFSFGGLVAAHVAARRPVRRLALLGPAGHGGRRRPRGALRSWKAAQQSGDTVALEAVMRHNLAMHMLHAEAADIDPLAVSIHTEACQRTRFRSKDISRAGGLADTLVQRHGPSLLAWGDHDVTAEQAVIGAALARTATHCRTHIVDGAGHWVQYQRADEINRLLLAWLGADLES